MAYYLEELIEEVISQNDIVDVISEYVTLKKSGRNFLGLCPFHREKTPSFSVSLDKQIFKCFGCSEGGNAISFVMKLENLDFWESVELLAQRAHIDLDKYTVKSNYTAKDNNYRKDLKEILFNINKEAGIYYHNNLIKLLEEKNTNLVKEYVLKRKFDIKTLKKFGIGFANGTTHLYDYLLEKGFAKEDILASGILVQNERSKIYDRFYNRLMFPIFDIRDRTIAFGGRVLDNSLPKYVNSPENEIYHKGRNLYGMNFAKKEKIEEIIVLEGYMDVIALQKNGFTNAVASLGTALTKEQARLMKKYTDKVIIGYDQDNAGQEATLRSLDILVASKLNVKVLILDKEDAKDPDEYINKYGVERFKNCLDNSISLVEFKIAKLEKSLDLSDVDSKIKFLTQMAEILARIENNIEREIYIDKIAKQYNVGSGPILKEIEKRFQIVPKESFFVDVQSINRKMHLMSNIRKRQEQYIVALLLGRDVTIQNEIFKEIPIEDIEDENVKKVYEFILALKDNYDINKIDILSKIKDDNIMKEITEIMYLDILNLDKNKLLENVLKNKRKEKLYLRRDEILKRLDQDILKDEQEILEFELNQIILELGKQK